MTARFDHLVQQMLDAQTAIEIGICGGYEDMPHEQYLKIVDMAVATAMEHYEHFATLADNIIINERVNRQTKSEARNRNGKCPN